VILTAHLDNKMPNDRLQVVREKLENIPVGKDGLRLWLRIMTCSQMIEEQIKAILRDEFSMTLPRFEVLAALDRVPDGLSMVELSRWLMVTKGNITGIAERLSEDKFITRKPIPTDRRSFCVTLTDEGRELYRQMADRYEQCIDEIFTDISQEEMDAFMGLLSKTKEAVDSFKVS